MDMDWQFTGFTKNKFLYLFQIKGANKMNEQYTTVPQSLYVNEEFMQYLQQFGSIFLL